MKEKNPEYCIECCELTEFIYDGSHWVCQNCGSYDSQGEFGESLPENDDNEYQSR